MFASCNNCHQCKELKTALFYPGEEAFGVEFYDAPKSDKIKTACPFCGERTLVIKCYRDIFDAGWREEEDE